MSNRQPLVKIFHLWIALGLLWMAMLPRPAQAASLRPFTVPSRQAANRHLVVIESYSPTDPINPGQDFNLKVRLVNSGQSTANNVVAVFTNGDLVTRETGGVVNAGQINVGNHATITQPLTATWGVWGLLSASITMSLTYSDDAGTTYTADFTITFIVVTPYGNSPTPTPTITPTRGVTQRPQMVVTSYVTDPVLLKPGTRFTLKLDVQNMGNGNATQVTLIVGGGSTSSGDVDGTPVPGGTSGSTGEFTNFAPLGTSNIQNLGSLSVGGSLSAEQAMIVNTTTTPGAYPMRISFSYRNEQGRFFTDDQVITLLVYFPPTADINYSREPDPFFVGQPGILPVQIINLGKNAAVFGNMKVNAVGAQLANNIVFVGYLDPGGYFPLDAQITPEQAGPLEVLVTVDYTDDFNQPRTIENTFIVQVMESGGVPGEGEIPPEGLNGGQVPPAAPETIWTKIWRFILGLLGLDSSAPSPDTIPPGEVTPGEEQPGGGEVVPPPVRPPKG